jgi:hypothetical protein
MAVNYFYLIDARHNRHALGIKYQELMVGEAFFSLLKHRLLRGKRGDGGEERKASFI